MLTLIAREIRDHSVYFGAGCAITAMIVATIICMILYGIVGAGIATVSMFGGLLFLDFAVLGIAQMYGDRANRVSTLLSTQAATRNRILIARILVGAITVLITLIPALIATVLLLKLRQPPLEFYAGMVWDISIILILLGLACHAMGLLVGWTSSRARVILGAISLLVLLASLVVVKGFGPSAIVVLALLLAAAWGRIWHTFTSTSL
jgi:hypothetical protein